MNFSHRMATALCLFFGLALLCRGARPSKEEKGVVSTQGASVTASGHLLSQHHGRSTKQNDQVTASSHGPEPEEESHSILMGPQTLQGLLPNIQTVAESLPQTARDAAFGAMDDMGINRESRLKEYIGQEKADETNPALTYPGDGVYTPEFEAFYGKKLYAMAKPFEDHGKAVADRAAAVWNGLVHVNKATEKIDASLNDLGEKAKSMQNQVNEENNEVAGMSKNGFEAYNRYVEERPPIDDNWKQGLGKLSDERLVELGQKHMQTEKFDFWHPELPVDAKAQPLSYLKSKDDLWIYNKDLPQHDRDETRRNPLSVEIEKEEGQEEERESPRTPGVPESSPALDGGDFDATDHTQREMHHFDDPVQSQPVSQRGNDFIDDDDDAMGSNP